MLAHTFDHADMLISGSREIVGHDNVLTARADTESYTTDWTKMYSGEALAVAK